jgi:hypothetical protein
MRLALDILEGQNLARKNHHRVRPRRAGAAELAPVDALDRHCEFVPSVDALAATVNLPPAPEITTRRGGSPSTSPSCPSCCGVDYSITLRIAAAVSAAPGLPGWVCFDAPKTRYSTAMLSLSDDQPPHRLLCFIRHGDP